MSRVIAAQSLLRRFLRQWEWTLALLLVLVFVINANLSPHFLDLRNLMDSTLHFTEKGIIALIMTFIVISGNIDLSVASNMAMSAAVMGVAYRGGAAMWLAVLFCLATGTCGGLFNGLVITRFRLPAIVVTLGSYSLFRGIAYVLLGNKAVTGYPYRFAELGQGYLGQTPVPYQLIIFAVLAVAFGLLLHRSTFGRFVYAIGNNEATCRYSGVPVDRIKVILFTLSGLMSSFAAVLLTSRIYSTRPNIAQGFELEVVTAVVLGGVSISGGSGNMIGVVLSLFLIGTTRFGMSLLNIPGQVMTVVTGALLIVAILLPRMLSQIADRADSQSTGGRGLQNAGRNLQDAARRLHDEGVRTADREFDQTTPGG